MAACGSAEETSVQLSRMAQVGTLADIGAYAPLPTSAPQISAHLSDAGWVLAFTGEWPQLNTGESWIDPMCVVVGGDPVLYAVGPRRDLRSGRITRGYFAAASAPTLALPTLAP
jgi:hypothetical protein